MKEEIAVNMTYYSFGPNKARKKGLWGKTKALALISRARGVIRGQLDQFLAKDLHLIDVLPVQIKP